MIIINEVQIENFVDPHFTFLGGYFKEKKPLMYTFHYGDAKIGCFSVACHLLCNYMPRDLPGRGTKGPGMPRDLPQPYIHTPLPLDGGFWVAQLRHLGCFRLHNVWHRCHIYLWKTEMIKARLLLRRPSLLHFNWTLTRSFIKTYFFVNFQNQSLWTHLTA